MDAKIFIERIDKLMDETHPETSLERLPEDVQQAFAQYLYKEMKSGGFVTSVLMGLDPAVSLAGAMAKGFVMGHAYAVQYGNLEAEYVK